MSLRNYFYRFGKYILTFFFVTLLMVLFGPLQAQAAITKEVTTDGFKLSGTGSMNVWDGDEVVLCQDLVQVKIRNFSLF